MGVLLVSTPDFGIVNDSFCNQFSNVTVRVLNGGKLKSHNNSHGCLLGFQLIEQSVVIDHQKAVDLIDVLYGKPRLSQMNNFIKVIHCGKQAHWHGLNR